MNSLDHLGDTNMWFDTTVFHSTPIYVAVHWDGAPCGSADFENCVILCNLAFDYMPSLGSRIMIFGACVACLPHICNLLLQQHEAAHLYRRCGTVVMYRQSHEPNLLCVDEDQPNGNFLRPVVHHFSCINSCWKTMSNHIPTSNNSMNRGMGPAHDEQRV